MNENDADVKLKIFRAVTASVAGGTFCTTVGAVAEKEDVEAFAKQGRKEFITQLMRVSKELKEGWLCDLDLVREGCAEATGTLQQLHEHIRSLPKGAKVPDVKFLERDHGD